MRLTETYYELVPGDRYKNEKVVITLAQDESLIKPPCKLSADQATHTGIAIYDSEGKLIMSTHLIKEELTTTEYKLEMEAYIQSLVDKYKIDTIFCEDVFLGVNFHTVTQLIIVRECFKDVAVKNEVEIYAVPNTRWKAMLAAPNTWTKAIDDKKQVKHYVQRWFPLIVDDSPEDVIDAIGIGIALHLKKVAKINNIFHTTPNTRLGVEVELVIVDSIDEILPRAMDNRLFRKAIEKGVRYFDFHERYDLETNFKYLLTIWDVLGITIIPDNRALGQILLKYRVKKSQIGKDQLIIGIGCRK